MRIPTLLTLALIGVPGCLLDPGGGSAKKSEWDVRGNYTLTYDDQLQITLNLAGAVRQATVQSNGMVDFGSYNGQPLVLDLAQYCARSDVKCPSEVLWSKVAVDEQDVDKSFDVHVLQVIDNTQPDLPAGEHAAVVGGLVQHTQDDAFIIGLGGGAQGSGDCVALSLSVANGRFSHKGETFATRTVYRDGAGHACNPDAGSASDGGDAGDGGDASDGGTQSCGPVQVTELTHPDGAAVDGIKDGKVAITWVAACAFGSVVAGAASLTLETGFTGTRTGDFKAPKYQPVAPLPVDGDLPTAEDLAGLSDGGAGD